MEYLNGCVNKSKSTDNRGIQPVANNSRSGIGENGNENTATITTTQPLNTDLKGTEMNGTQPQSTPNPSNPASSNNGNAFSQMDQTNPPIQSEENTITVFNKSDHSILLKPDSIHSSLIFRDDCDSVYINKSDHSILLKPDSIHSSLIFRDDCDSVYRVSINNWTMLETLVIGNRCCSKTGSFEIRNCPQLKSIKVGNHSFTNSSCYMFSIEL